MDPVVHFEVPFDDKERAKKFYSTVFEWRLMDWNEGEMDYTMAYSCEIDEANNNMPKEKARINGGMMPRSPLGESSVLVMNVKNLDETMEKITANGGSEVMPKTKMSGMGYYARAKDSEGNVIGVWEDIKK
jgi:uncharacterized protein